MRFAAPTRRLTGVSSTSSFFATSSISTIGVEHAGSLRHPRRSAGRSAERAKQRTAPCVGRTRWLNWAHEQGSEAADTAGRASARPLRDIP